MFKFDGDFFRKGINMAWKTKARRNLSILAALMVLGCGETSAPIAKDKSQPGGEPIAKTAEGADKKKDAHHAAGGPHHGAIAEWGDEEYHVEFTVDHPTKTATIYILGPDLKTPAPIAAKEVNLTIRLKPPIPLTLNPKPAPADPMGLSSCFVGVHDVFAKETEFAGVLSAEFAGKSFAGDFAEKPGDDHHHHEPETASPKTNKR